MLRTPRRAAGSFRFRSLAHCFSRSRTGPEAHPVCKMSSSRRKCSCRSGPPRTPPAGRRNSLCLSLPRSHCRLRDSTDSERKLRPRTSPQRDFQPLPRSRRLRLRHPNGHQGQQWRQRRLSTPHRSRLFPGRVRPLNHPKHRNRSCHRFYRRSHSRPESFPRLRSLPE